jgi:hypothetical protein
MEPLKPSKTIKIYQLIKQSGMYFMSAGSAGTQSIGLGFYSNLQEAEFNRTSEILKSNSDQKEKFHVFELEIPNPAYTGAE